jgi:IS4 transposase
MLGEILKTLPRREIKKIVNKHKSDRYRKSFETWDHLVAMLTGQLAGITSLRDLEVTLNSHSALHYHMGINEVKRSTLADANSKRGYHCFRDIALTLIKRLAKNKKEVEKVVTILDSSLIRLAGRGHEWALSTTSRDHNMGLKIHVQYNHSDDHIEYVNVENATCNDVTIAQQLHLESNKIYVFDKAYCDYNWWKAMHDKGSIFVTRLKVNAAYKVLQTLNITKEDQRFILKDQLITLSQRHRHAKKTINGLAGVPLRLIQIQHPSNKDKPFIIVTNAIDTSPACIAGWYKERWSVELLFKWLKQNLKIKRFMGENRNAIMIQIYVAIIAYALLKLYRETTRQLVYRLKDMCTLVKTNLFTRPSLQERMYKRKRLLREPSTQLSFGF